MLITSPWPHAILLPRPGPTNCHWQTERSGKAARLFRAAFMWSIIIGWQEMISGVSSVATMYSFCGTCTLGACIWMSYGVAVFPPYGNVCTWACVLIHKHKCSHTRTHTDLTSIHGIKWSVKNRSERTSCLYKQPKRYPDVPCLSCPHQICSRQR